MLLLRHMPSLFQCLPSPTFSFTPSFVISILYTSIYLNLLFKMSKTGESYEASAKALKSLTSAAKDPMLGINHPANHESSHSWLAKILPASTLDNMETRFHLGNYVIDRKTGEKSFEAMSIYVRVSIPRLDRKHSLMPGSNFVQSCLNPMPALLQTY